MKKILFYLLFVLSISSCITKERKYPVIIPSSYDTILENNFDSIQIAKNIVYSIGFNRDTLTLNERNQNKYLHQDEVFSFNKYSEHKKTDSIVLYVDVDNPNFHTNFIASYFSLSIPPPPSDVEIDSVEINNLQKAHQKRLLKELNTHYKAYPFYIYNTSKNTQEILKPIAGGDLFMILEAKDEKGLWKPIEYFEQFGFLCGTGHQNYILKPNHYIIGAIKKYDGNYETIMRIKLRSFDKIFYSNEFQGKMNYSQFHSKDIVEKLKNRFNYRDKKEPNYREKNMFLNH
ncbi:hypothetical protein [Polaribacter sp.]|uniref:hypothetical protein n=1 Tax=Polaribacter sp. TaxID=1920175 RepID=UPI003F6C925A